MTNNDASEKTTVLGQNTIKTTNSGKAVGRNIIETIRKEVRNKKFVDINYDDHCEWHDAGQGDCENN